MGLETATYISGLNASNPVDATDLVNQGDDHLRLVKSTLLNTFPNITGAMTRSHTQLNNAPDRTVSTNFTVTDAPDLVDTGNALNIGNLAGAHLAFGPAQVQAKASATTAAALTLNALGGDVTIRSVLSARTGGADVLSAVIPNLTDNGNALNIGTLAGAHVAYGPAQIQGKGSAVTAAALAINSLGGDVNVGPQSGSGRVNLFDNGNGVVARTRDGGLSIIGDATDVLIDLYSDDGLTQEGYIQLQHSGLMELRNQIHGGTIRGTAEDAGGVARILFNGDPSGPFTAYYAGNTVFYTLANGIQARDPSSNLPRIFLVDNASANVMFIGRSSGGWSGLLGYTHGEPIELHAEDAGGTDRTLFQGDPDSDVKLYNAGTEMIRTAAHGNDQTTGASVRHYDNSFYEVGLAPAPYSSTASNVTLQRSNASKVNRMTAGTQVAITAANTDLVADGTMFMVINSTGSSISIVLTSVALNWVDGAGGATGTRTLADEGIMTIYKAADGVYFCWGVGIS